LLAALAAMETAVHSAFAHWEGFYVIVGTSAAALTGVIAIRNAWDIVTYMVASKGKDS
jgi:hypothetical protein